MTKRSADVIHLVPGQRRHEELVIDLASPQHEVGLYNQAGVEVDSNNFSAQLQGLSSSQEAADGQAYHQHEQGKPVATTRKRMLDEMAGVEQQQQERQGGQPYYHCPQQRPQSAHQMQWGTTGPRMQRSRVTAVPPQQQQPAAGPMPDSAAPTPPSVHPSGRSRRRVTVTHHRKQAAAATESAPIVIDDESPAPTARQQQHRGGLTASTAGCSRPAPMTIQGNPRYASRSPAAAAAVFQHSHQPSSRRSHMRTNPFPETMALRDAAEYDAAGSSGSGSNDNSGSSCDAELARKVQEQEDAQLARRMMQQEQLQVQKEASEQHRRRMELMRQIEAEEAAAEAAAAVAARAASPGHARGRRGGRAPQRAEGPQQAHRQVHWGMAMAHALLQLPRWGASGGAGRGRGLPPGLTAMREAMLGMQAAGLPPHMLFSDRDFGADDYEMLLRLDETVEKKGASTNTIEALPTQTVPAGGIAGAAGEKLSCPVCLEEFVEGAELRLLPCLHRFHKACIDKWLGVKSSCPVCNRECQ